MGKKSCFFVVITVCFFASCAQQAPKPPATVSVTPQKPLIMEPFRFHKMIEVSPGNDFDILSWGRGSTEAGAFEILHSDSSEVKYTTTTGDLEGQIIDAYNSDMDMDGNPEILIQAKAKDTSNYAVIYAFEFNGSKANKLDFPKLTKSQAKGYRGFDDFYIKDGQFMREFPIYDGIGKDAKITGAKRVFQYGLRNNEFTVKQLSKDSTDVKEAVADQPVKKETTSDNGSSSKNNSSLKKKKHKTEEPTHKRKKKRHYHSD
jgi:hypothetical protein